MLKVAPFQISNCQSLMAAGQALDSGGKQRVQLFQHTNASRFLLLPLECVKCLTSCLLLHVEHLPPSLETHSSNEKQGKDDKQILVGLRVWRRCCRAENEIRRRKMSTLAIFNGKEDGGSRLECAAKQF